MEHLAIAALEAGLDVVRRSPTDAGTVAMIVRRPAVDAREILGAAALDPSCGVVGDTWDARGSSRTDDGSAHPEMQLTLMNVRFATLIAGSLERAALAGDQLYVDLSLGYDTLPPGTRLELGTAAIEITSQPHRGCKKFVARFGADALRLANSPAGRALNLRGIYAHVVRAGSVHRGDPIQIVAQA